MLKSPLAQFNVCRMPFFIGNNEISLTNLSITAKSAVIIGNVIVSIFFNGQLVPLNISDLRVKKRIFTVKIKKAIKRYYYKSNTVLGKDKYINLDLRIFKNIFSDIVQRIELEKLLIEEEKMK